MVKSATKENSARYRGMRVGAILERAIREASSGRGYLSRDQDKVRNGAVGLCWGNKLIGRKQVQRTEAEAQLREF